MSILRRLPRDRIAAELGVTIAVCAILTVLVSGWSAIGFAYRSPELHVAIETLVATAYALAASLLFGRARRTRRLPDLLLFVALVMLAGATGVLALGAAIAGQSGTGFATWAPATARLVGGALLLLAAFAPQRHAVGRVGDPVRALIGCAIALALIGTAALVVGDRLPPAVDPGLSPDASGRPRIVGNPVVLALQVTLLVLHSAAAVGFARSARRHRDELLEWLAIASTLAAFARLNFFLFPSLYSEWFYTGDAFRMASALTILFGVAHVVFGYERRLAEVAVFDERRRVARELHDGLAQELSFIKQQTESLLERPGGSPVAERLAAAADRALEESRFAIAELARPIDASLLGSLQTTARLVAGRAGATVHVTGDDVEHPGEIGEALTRVVREAVSNAVRHGRARSVVVEVSGGAPLVVRVRDDGCGFDPEAPARPDAFGLVSMRERVEALGGTLGIESRPGGGTTVEARIP